MRKFLLLHLLLLSLTTFSFSQDLKSLSELYLKREYALLDSLCEKTLQENPGNIDISLLYGRSQADQGKYKNAIPWLKKAVMKGSDSWQTSWAYAYLGVCCFNENQIPIAKAYLDSCINTKGTKNSIEFAKKKSAEYGLSDFYKDWIILETEHLRFHFQDTLKIAGTLLYMNQREEAFENLNEIFPAELNKKIDFFTWTDKDAGRKVLSRNVGFSLTKECIIHAYYQQTKGHELTHILVSQSIKPVKVSRFINEGVAVALDMSSRNKMNSARETIKQAGLTKVSIEELWKSGEGDEAVFYPIAGAWCLFMIKELGMSKFREVLQDQSYENAAKILGEKLKLLEKEFENELFKNIKEPSQY